jgi:uncharacterized protein (TIGR03067 family)
MKSIVASLVVVSLAFAGDPPKDEVVSGEVKKFQGDWVVVSIERNGTKTDPVVTKSFHRTIEGKKFTITYENNEGFHTLEGTISLDPAQDPKTIDAVMTDISNKGKILLGIYKLENDVQTVCFATPGQKRPTKFDSSQGTLTIWKHERTPASKSQ